jgi:hypothetical protein
LSSVTTSRFDDGLYFRKQNMHIAFSWTVAMLRYDVIFSLRHEYGKYSITKKNFLSYTLIFRK